MTIYGPEVAIRSLLEQYVPLRQSQVQHLFSPVENEPQLAAYARQLFRSQVRDSHEGAEAYGQKFTEQDLEHVGHQLGSMLSAMSAAGL